MFSHALSMPPNGIARPPKYHRTRSEMAFDIRASPFSSPASSVLLKKNTNRWAMVPNWTSYHPSMALPKSLDRQTKIHRLSIPSSFDSDRMLQPHIQVVFFSFLICSSTLVACVHSLRRLISLRNFDEQHS
jgi:hypothetical protein